MCVCVVSRFRIFLRRPGILPLVIPVDYEQSIIWHKVIEDDGNHIVPHVRKIDTKKRRGLYTYFYPPRIGIDFYDAEQDLSLERARGYIPNLELGDVARIVRVLELIPRKRTKLEIGLAFEKELERRVILRFGSSEVSLSYHAKHRSGNIDFEFSFSKEGLRKIISALKEGKLRYLGIILEYVVLQKLNTEYISHT